MCTSFSRIGKQARAQAWAALLLAMFLVASFSAHAQSRANVTVDLGRTVNVLSDTSLGLPATMVDANNFNLASVPYLRAAGITSARYPGNHGVADLYHWSTKTTTRYRGDDSSYIADESNFAHFALFAENLGQAVIVINYGSNSGGTGGGEPAEAAAWVAYANGNSADTRPLGKDSAGQDWHTVGYWAAIRSQAPLAADDGLNFLRIQHPRPFGFKLWQIGDEVYNNGFYGEHTGTPDLHGPIPENPKDLSRLKANPKLSPEAYAENFKLFAAAMKAVDSSIEIGAAFTVPPSPNSNEWAPDWNRQILKGACAQLDFATFDWSMQPLSPPDWKTLDEASLLGSLAIQIAQLVSPMLDDYKHYCPAGHLPRLAFAPVSIASWVKVDHPVVKALWIADFDALLVESGSANINWNEMYGESMLSADHKTLGPAFFGLQMLHTIVHSPGDLLLEARSSSSMVSAHAASRRDGFVGLMLINKDPQNAATVKVSYANGVVGAEGRRIDYGPSQFAAAKPAVTQFSAQGNEFTITVPPYTITDILLPGRK